MTRWTLALLALSACASAVHFAGAEQEPIRLASTETEITLQAGPHAPRVIALALGGGAGWKNQTPELLIDHVELEGETHSLNWHFNPEASQIGSTEVKFVYDSETPHLRLSWNWRVRAAVGPLEHSIRIENLSRDEIWIPLQDSSRFDWHVARNVLLEHLWVEKGAGKPSDEGTHRVNLTQHYRWVGESSTYAHPSAGEAREIIPWLLVGDPDGDQLGWYLGIEFSGRTRITLERDGNSVRGRVGLNPTPGPFKTSLPAGGVFETLSIFLGAYAGGPDFAGNILRRWVRQALNNPATIQNHSYPLLVNNSWVAECR
jgi:hypothetical protein